MWYLQVINKEDPYLCHLTLCKEGQFYFVYVTTHARNGEVLWTSLICDFPEILSTSSIMSVPDSFYWGYSSSFWSSNSTLDSCKLSLIFPLLLCWFFPRETLSLSPCFRFLVFHLDSSPSILGLFDQDEPRNVVHLLLL